MSKSKKDILSDETDGIFDEHEGGITGIFNAMDFYAKQESIESMDWAKSEYEWDEKQNSWIPKLTAFISSEERLTTEQLYTLFTQSKNEIK